VLQETAERLVKKAVSGLRPSLLGATKDLTYR